MSTGEFSLYKSDSFTVYPTKSHTNTGLSKSPAEQTKSIADFKSIEALQANFLHSGGFAVSWVPKSPPLYQFKCFIDVLYL